MRIISGNLKGRKIAQPNSKNTRPLKDLTKESIFNIMEHSNLLKFSFEKSTILDLFSGVGSFGLECISRGAKNVIFFENSPKTVKILKKNINDLNCEKKSQIIAEDIFVGKFSTSIGTRQIERKIQKGEQIPEDHLIAYRLAREEILYVWLECIEKIIKNYFIQIGMVFDDKKLFQEKFPPEI